MAFLDKIVANTVRIVGELSESVVACSFLMAIFSFIAMLAIRGIVSGLFEMHRSRSAIKKVKKEYSLGQKLLLKHAWQDCIHARRFCRRLIIAHHCIFCLFLIELLLALFSNIWPILKLVVAWYTIVFLDCITIPVCLLNFILDRYPFQKWKHEFRFRKYHNTSNHDSLW